MDTDALNYRHLYYFWIAANEGSFTQAAKRLGVAVQTVSAQIGQLEVALGKTLFAPQGRRLVPTEAGRIAVEYADRIFQLGERLRDALADDSLDGAVRLTVGLSDALPKLIAHRFLEGVLSGPGPVRLVCEEADFDELIAQLTTHRLDVVLTDRPAAVGGGLRVHSHALGECAMAFFATPPLAARCRDALPGSLRSVPILLPTRGNALRGRLDQWFAARDVRPRVAGEFEDSELLMAFGRTGLGLFAAPSLLETELAAQYGVVPVGRVDGVSEQYFAITAERRIQHPAVAAILATAEGLPDGDPAPGRRADHSAAKSSNSVPRSSTDSRKTG